MNSKLTHQEQIFIFGTFLYVFFCVVFALSFNRGAEVQFIASHYSSSTNIFFSYITRIAEGPGIAIFILIVLLKERKQLFHFSLIALFTFLSISTLKYWIFPNSFRPRAWAIEQQIQLPLNTSNLMHFSFPSGHTAFAFCLMYCLVILYNKSNWTFMFLCIGILVGLSRIYLLAHFVIDTGIGALIGLSMGIIGNRLYDRYIGSRMQ